MLGTLRRQDCARDLTFQAIADVSWKFLAGKGADEGEIGAPADPCKAGDGQSEDAVYAAC